MHLHLWHGQRLVSLRRHRLRLWTVALLLCHMLTGLGLHVLSLRGHMMCLGLHGLALLRGQLAWLGIWWRWAWSFARIILRR